MPPDVKQNYSPTVSHLSADIYYITTLSAASGAGGGAATLGMDTSSQLAPLTVDFHEPGFVATLSGENAFRAESRRRPSIPELPARDR
jgi:hypothetical protein